MTEEAPGGGARALLASDGEPLKVVFIAGAGHSGSTVIAKVIGHLDGFSPCGELRFFWKRGLCGCGTRVDECEFWSTVLAHAFGTAPWGEIAELVALQHRVVRTRPRQLLAMRRAAGNEGLAGRQLRAYAARMDRLYDAFARETGARVLVDSSKVPGDAYAAALFSGAQIHVLHLVRDPRKVTYSWQRSGRMTALQGAGHWVWWNSVIELLLRGGDHAKYMRVRYEDFCEAPGDTLGAIAAWLGEDSAALPRFSGERTVEFGRRHMIGGSESSFSEGPTEIAESKATTNVPRGTRALATLAGAGLMPRYSYSLVDA